MKNLKTLSLILLLLPVFLSGQSIPERPNPSRLVNDFAGILTQSQKDKLEQKLVTFFDTTGNQIAVVLVPSLNGYDKAEFAYEIGEKWGVGKKEFDNGVVVLVKPKTKEERGQAFIATGYGLEGAIPDAIAKRIVEKEMIPYFKQNDYYTGLDKATDVLMALAAGEYSAKQYEESGGEGSGSIIPFIIVVLIFIIIIRKSRNDHFHTGGRSGGGLPFWTALWLGSTMGGSGGSWSSGSSGGFGDSGGFGGFGGFGGGSFGGGGAGGSW